MLTVLPIAEGEQALRGERGREQIDGWRDVLVIVAVADHEPVWFVRPADRRLGTAVVLGGERKVDYRRSDPGTDRKARGESLAREVGDEHEPVGDEGHRAPGRIEVRRRPVHDVPGDGVEHHVKVDRAELVKIGKLVEPPRLTDAYRGSEVAGRA